MSIRSKTYIRTFLILIVCSSLLSGMTPSTTEKLPPLFPYKTETPPILDGILDDPVWQNAPQETGFKTYHPDYGKPPVEDTIVYYAYDRENLYFGFRCFDSQPNKIKASISARDKIRPDDWICINLDSFNDQQSLYAIYCNPMGIQMDSRFEGGQEDLSVDIVYYSAGKIDDQGYAIELRVPFKSIRLSQNEPVEMGVIFERFISLESEASTYPPLSPAYGANFLTQTRTIVFKDIKHYTLLEILPGITYSSQRTIDGGKLGAVDDRGDLSLTAKYGITSRLILDGTYNPDFSQVEADAGQVDFNLRYALFYPETRSFFLEGLEKFNYGGSHEGDPIGEIVHTRTIVNPLLGFKLNGRIGDKNTIASIYAMDDLPETEQDEYAHFAIFRYKRSLPKDGFIGGFYTGRERDSGFNRVFGSDGQVRLNPSSILGFHFFVSQTQKDETDKMRVGHAMGFHYFSTTRNWLVMFGFQDIDGEFQTETGYMTRTGLVRVRSGIVRMLYPKSKLIQRIDPIIHSSHIQDKSSRLYETSNSFDLRLILPKSTFVLFGGRYSTEAFLDERFNTSRFRIIGQRQFTKQFFINLQYYYGRKIRYISDPFQGRGSDAMAALNFVPTENLHFDLSLIYSDFYRSSDSLKEFDYMIVRSRNTYQVNKYLFFRGIVEYNSFRKRLVTDFLASFTYIPGTVIHVGYGSLYEKIQWENDGYIDSNRFLETKRGFFFKASFLWRL